MGRTDELEASRGSGRGATLEDVARVAGVSRATVSRVVRGDVQVRRDKVAKVEAAVQELGYVPNTAARSLASRQSGAVALIVPEHETRVFTDPFFSTAISGVSRPATSSCCWCSAAPAAMRAPGVSCTAATPTGCW